jgi:hypothetical protein
MKFPFPYYNIFFKSLDNECIIPAKNKHPKAENRRGVFSISEIIFYKKEPHQQASGGGNTGDF